MDSSNIKSSATISHLLSASTQSTVSTPLASLTASTMVISSQIRKMKVVCEPLVSIYVFRICYVQPIPLPPEVEMLQKLNAQGLDFVKIPIGEKQNRLFLKEQIYTLLKLTNINGEYVNRLIADFNSIGGDESRSRLLNVVKVAREYCELNCIEFLVDRIDSVMPIESNKS